MARKKTQSAGSYSLLALLKRTLFLHETAAVDELVEEVHEYMLREQSVEQIKDRYVAPILQSNPSFLEVETGSNVWKLSEGNKVNDSIYELFRKYHTPLSERQVLNRLVKEEHLAKIDIVLDLKNDARFSDIEGGKHWILSEWIVINEYARSVLLKVKGGLSEKELLERVIEEYHADREKAIFLPVLDDRFVKKEKRWTLKRFVEQKTKLRASRIERLYAHLQKSSGSLTSNELTTFVLNLPANATDVDEKLAMDPRFIQVDGKWDLRERTERQVVEEIPEEASQWPEAQEETPQEAPLSFDSLFTEESALEEPLGPEEEATPSEELQEDLPKGTEEAEVPPADVEQEPLLVEVPLEEEIEETEEVETVGGVAEELEITEEELTPELEYLRKKVIAFLQDAFQSEGITYSADIIDDLVTSEYRAEFFEEFCLEHFANPAKNRELTDTDIIKFMAYLAEPTFNDKIIDPCCGTGAFLTQILQTLYDNLHYASWTEKDASIEYELPTGQFYFVQLTEEEQQSLPSPLDEITSKYLPIERFCKQRQLTGVDSERFCHNSTDLNLALRGFPEVVLHHDDALTSKHLGMGLYDLVIGNPPASGDLPTRFLRRSLALAKPGGKILLLLPETMFSSLHLASATLRNQIAAQTIVKAVIEFPEPYNDKAYGPKRVLFYCTKKQLEGDQQSSMFVGRIPDFDGLRDIIEVLEDPEAPVTDSEKTIPVGLLMFILSSYQQSAYNLLLEGLRRQVLEGGLISLDAWTHVRDADHYDAPEEQE